MARRVFMAAVTLLAFGVVGVSAASAETKMFGYTGGEQEFKVPTGVTSVHVVAVGAPGGEGDWFFTEIPGGQGGVVSGDVAVTPGQVLYVEVGGRPSGGGFCGPFGDCVGGFNGGASDRNGGAGGGASDVRTISVGSEPSPGNEASLTSRLLVAAGGGGGGEEVYAPECATAPHLMLAGGHGGSAEESGGDGGSCDGAEPGLGGGAGNGTEGGAGGRGAPFGGAGTLGIGGKSSNGGGGGGGLYGGGGGGAWRTNLHGEIVGGPGGGGGGSDLVPHGGTSELAKAGMEPSVTLSYTPKATLFFPYSARPSASIPFAVRAVTLETVGKHKITCLSREGSVAVKTEYSLQLGLHLYSCTSSRRPCDTTGVGEANQPQGQMYLELLGELVFLNKAKHQVGILFSPYNSGSYEDFHVSCREAPNDNIGGQVLARISPVGRVIVPPLTFSLTFEKKAGMQNPGLYEGSGPITLTTTPEGGEAEETGLSFSSTLAFPEPMAILD